MPERTPEFQRYAEQFLDSAVKAQSRLPVRAQDQLSRVLDRFEEEPDRFPNRIEAIGKTGNVLYKHPDPPFEITCRIDRERKVITYIDFSLRVMVGSLVVISYSHADNKSLQELKKFLKPLVTQAKIRVWDDTEIEAGDRWREQITEFLGSAKVAVFLVSQDFIASDFITRQELPLLQETAKKNDVRLLWIAVRPHYDPHLFLKDLQALNDPSRPLSSFGRKADRERELVRIVEKIAAAAEHVAVPKAL
jgi:TIR domain-containing protein